MSRTASASSHYAGSLTLAGFDRAAIGRLALAIFLVGGALAALTGFPLVYRAANRLVVGTPLYAGAVLGSFAWSIAGLAVTGGLLLGFSRGRLPAFAALVLLAAALMLLTVALGVSAADLTAGQPPAMRARLAAGAWISLLLLAGSVASAVVRTRGAWVGILTAALLLAAFLVLARAGTFDALSLAVEYRARRDVLHAAILQHLALCAGAVALALLATVLLSASGRGRGLVDLAISGVQVVPAVALFGALVAVTSGLLTSVPSLRDVGLSALGPGPAILGIAAYLLLPLWRGLHAGLQAPDPATIDAAIAIGLTPGQILRRVRLPLGAPILIGALRVAAVQSIGLATLGALVGAGGLGGIVFDGMAQFAPDLILLGAIPVIALSLAADRSLSLVEEGANRRWRP